MIKRDAAATPSLVGSPGARSAPLGTRLGAFGSCLRGRRLGLDRDGWRERGEHDVGQRPDGFVACERTVVGIAGKCLGRRDQAREGAPASCYSATKAAVRAFAHTLAAELVTRNIRVNTIGPGFIDTPTLGIATATPDERAQLHEIGDAVTPMKRHGTPAEVARAAIFLALDATFTTGTELQVDGGISGIDPPV